MNDPSNIFARIDLMACRRKRANVFEGMTLNDFERGQDCLVSNAVAPTGETSQDNPRVRPLNPSPSRHEELSTLLSVLIVVVSNSGILLCNHRFAKL
jgi:hypothetical protein